MPPSKIGSGIKIVDTTYTTRRYFKSLLHTMRLSGQNRTGTQVSSKWLEGGREGQGSLIFNVVSDGAGMRDDLNFSLAPREEN